ncbi:MAG: pyridoxamine 5'-phosphate oxidase family protein [Alcanivorax sp.]|jgi:hypothetical protein|uniref:pyridoxamine 5'-phosphate oxidase family protein n=1 Tax=Alloalcanivorax TaxID=3020832 RepID=UPI0019AF2C9B|nr:pyridoxamine 5'-phosphate oxidase family protein [Alcanivorax sp.]MBL4723660.1 pyridoxamine 5'-phosphate oxidase family protein [Alcanivorax sp.]MCH9782478.1 pyridoxamine 5'-phosphate oxidase family protein [Gammaproteobacteria bacterium]MEC8881187.1 pyridoxamine 5'-phosphate oxidase family protein [Pseudomonadota bacterium]MED5603055.1 pyridoxamine 5'-phosphate oxidase family protein [Pseudomonadota bacterium]|tara:strand:- start:43672 stop:44229 length:558 start_codon:yes stop_codon:yes gene_type:complete
MSLPQRWTDWFEATRKAAPHCFMQLATVGDDGGARCRTLSLRERHGRALWFTTDQRSEKAMQLERQAGAEACWYDLTSRTQWRFRGRVHFLTPQQHPEDTLRLWRLIDREARARFCGPPPGSLWQPPKSDHYRSLPPTPEDHPAEDFSILVLTADQVDVLELAESPHRHWQYHGEGRGAPTRLVP